jgi:hypothetical protein
MEVTITKDKQELERLEGVIRKNFGAFYEVGRALIEIRDNELYLMKEGGKYQTFEAYCKGAWDMSKGHAYRLIDSANVIDAVSPIGDIKPTTESQARPLARLDPDQQCEAWQKAFRNRPGR